MRINIKSPILTLLLSIFIFAALLTLLTWGNLRFVEQNPGGNDFLVHWVGTRKFIMEGISPYSDETAREIQMIAYGHPARGGEHELRVVYPFYSEIFFAPFAMLADYNLARAIWMTFLEIIVMGVAILAMRQAKWTPSLWLLPVYLLFALTWYHGARPIINGNAVVLVAFFILLGVNAVQKNRDVMAGVFFAFATIKPHLVILLILFVTLWAISHRRWVLIGWTFGWTLILVLFGMLFIPDWVLQNLWEVIRFPDYNPELTVGAVFENWWPGIGTQLRWGTTFLLVGLTAFEWWSAWGKGFDRFLWAVCLTLTVSQWIGIATDPGNFILLFLPLVMIFTITRERWGKGGDFIVLFWMAVLFVGIWALFLNTLIPGDQPQQSPVMFLPLPLFVLFGLYWIRWWVLRPSRMIISRK